MIEVNNLCKVFTRVVKDESSKKKKRLTKLKTKKEDFLAVNNVTFKAKE